MQLVEVFNSFILSRKLAGLSEKTIKSYRELVYPFVVYVGCSADYKFVLTEDSIQGYILELLEKDISKATLATYVRHVKVFLKWVSENYDVLFDYHKIKVPKSPKRRVKIYGDEEVAAIFNAIKAESDWLTLRNKSIIALMYDSGLRQNEVCTLQRDKLSFMHNCMTVYGKGAKERVVPIGRLTSKYLQDYLALCPYSSRNVFVNRRGDPLSCNAVKLLVRKLADILPFELSSHKLRHNFATNYCLDQYRKNGQVDIFRLMILMGHEDIETTKIYLHLAYEIIGTWDSISHLDHIIGE